MGCRRRASSFEIEFWRKHGVDVLDLPLERCIDALAAHAGVETAGGPRVDGRGSHRAADAVQGPGAVWRVRTRHAPFFGREREIEVIRGQPRGLATRLFLRAGRRKEDYFSAPSSSPAPTGRGRRGRRARQLERRFERRPARAIEEEARRVRPISTWTSVGACSPRHWGGTCSRRLYVVLDQFEVLPLPRERRTLRGARRDRRGREHRQHDQHSRGQLSRAARSAFKTQIPSTSLCASADWIWRRDAGDPGPWSSTTSWQEAASPCSPRTSSSKRSSTPSAQVGSSSDSRDEVELREPRTVDGSRAPYLSSCWSVCGTSNANADPLVSGLRHSASSAARHVVEHLERAMSDPLAGGAGHPAPAAMYNRTRHSVGNEDRAPRGRPRAVRLGRRGAGGDGSSTGSRAGHHPCSGGRRGGTAGTRSSTTCSPTPCWQRTQREADRRLEEERREGARRHRRLLALAGGSLVVVVAVLAGVLAMRSHSEVTWDPTPGGGSKLPGGGGERPCRARRGDGADQPGTEPLACPPGERERAYAHRWRTHSGAR